MTNRVTVLIYTFPKPGTEDAAFAKIVASIVRTWEHVGRLKTVIVASHRFAAVEKFSAEHANVELQIEPTVVPGNIKTMSLDCIKRLYRRFTTEYVLVIQDDGFPIRSGLEEFLDKCDFYGAPIISDGWKRKLAYAIGLGSFNGGFSLRSRRLCEYASRMWFSFFSKFMPEDHRHLGEDFYYTTLLKFLPMTWFKFRFPSEQEAFQFSVDTLGGRVMYPAGVVPFGLHGKDTTSVHAERPFLELAKIDPAKMRPYHRQMLVGAIEATEDIRLVNPADGEIAELVRGFWRNDPKVVRRIVDWGKGLVPDIVGNRYIGDIGTYRNSIRSILFHTRFRGPLKVLVLTRLEEILRNAVLFNCGEDKGERFYNLAHRLSFDRGDGTPVRAFIARLIVKETADGNRTWTVEFSDKKELTEVPTTGEAATVKATRLNPPSTHTILKKIYDVNGLRNSVTILSYTFPKPGAEDAAFAKIVASIERTWEHVGRLKTVIVASHRFAAVEKFSAEHANVELQIELTLKYGDIHTMSVDCNSKLYTRFSTPYVLIVQDDGYPLRKGLEEFVGKYDFIGAPYVRDVWWKNLICRGLNCWVQNGGFSLRSRRICEAAARYWNEKYHKLGKCQDASEDLFYTKFLPLHERSYRKSFRLATNRESLRFSWDGIVPISKPKVVPFGFHGKVPLG